MDLVGPIIEIVKFVGGPIVRYLKYQIKFNYHLQQFNENKVQLCNRKDRIESRLEIQLHYGQVAKEEVRTWLTDANNFIARQEVEDEVNSRGCLSCCCRVKILENRAHELKKIYDRGDKYINECLVEDDPSVLPVDLPAPELQGREEVKEEILACLTGDVVIKLGVWGMGGVGKTTIMKNVHNELLNDRNRKFKKVIWADVSQTLDIYNLQQQIASNLEEKKILEQQNTSVRAGMLLKGLERHRPYLLILDDVWNSFELKAVGIPEPLVGDGCKLVLTTRSQEVADAMDCKIIKVNTLSQGEDLTLFMHEVGNIVLSDQRCIKRTLEATLKEIVDECDGLPLAIVTVARSLKTKPDPQSWRVALNQMKDCKRNVAGTNDANPFGVFKFSYDRLEIPEIQHCFLCCALYPEDHNIPINSIIDYWIDEELIDEMETLQAMKEEGHEILKMLVDNCLLESSKDRLEGNCVRMHDLFRDMALHIARTSPRFMVEAGKALTKLPERGKWTEDLEKVSLMRNKIEEIPSSILSSKCTMLTTLLLSHNNLSTISKSVFEHMPALKILDLSYNYPLRSLPSSISKLVNLTTLSLQWCESLTKVPSFSEFAALKKLDLDGTKIKEVPKGLEMCTNLQQLFVGGSIALKEEVIERLGEVIKRLEKLEAFHGRFPTAHDWSFFWKCVHDHADKLSSYFLRVGRGTDFDRPRRGYRRVEFGGIDIVGENIILPPSVNGLFIHRCDSLRSLNDFTSIKDAKDLKSCEIERCKGMECVFSSWINPLIQNLEELSLNALDKLEGLFEAEVIAMSPPPPPGTFSSLKSIGLFNCGKIKKLIPSWKLLGYLQSLEHIQVSGCKELEEIIASDPEEFEATLIAMSPPPPPGTFSSLKSIGLFNCGKIKKLISSWKLLGYLQSLERLDIQSCEELKEIIASDPKDERGDIIILPKLKFLWLLNLPALKSICSRRAVMVCDSLESIRIDYCKGLRRIPLSFPG